MYHLGPGPFGATLLHHYSRRLKLPASRVPMFMLSKLLFHYVQRAGRGNLTRKWDLHFRFNQRTPLVAQSEEGRLLREALAMAINFGYGYRLATLRAILDGLRESIAPDVQAELFCDISHNGVSERHTESGIECVARHNACRLESALNSVPSPAFPSQLAHPPCNFGLTRCYPPALRSFTASGAPGARRLVAGAEWS